MELRVEAGVLQDPVRALHFCADRDTGADWYDLHFSYGFHGDSPG